MFDLEAHLVRQMVFSKATFGPGASTERVLDHIEREIREVRAEAAYPPGHTGGRGRYAASEWVDLVILALDGLTRELWANGRRFDPAIMRNYAAEPELISSAACELIRRKQGVNERRDWPDWRSADPDKAIEHDRSKDARAEKEK